MDIKILRQNQDAGGKVLKQNESSGGKILKQNYNFRRAFYSGSSNIYIKPNIDGYLFNNFTFLISFKRQLLNAHVFGFQTSHGDNLNYYSAESVMYARKNNTQVVYIAGSSVNAEKNFLAVKSLGNRHVNGITGIYLDTVIPTLPFNITNLRVATGTQVGSTTIGWTGQSIIELLIYDRSIPDEDYKYWHNLSNGNPPLSIVGMLVRYTNSLAEILDFSQNQDGSDMRVGVRNVGSLIYAHGEITGLPAGTLEEKRDYANANYFLLP